MDRRYLRDKVRRLGLLGAVQHYAGRALLSLGQLEVYRVLRLTPGDAGAGSPGIPSAVCGLVSPDRLRRAAQDPAGGLAAAEVEEALSRGERCYGTFVGAVLASHAWYAAAGTPAHLQGDLFVEVDPAWAYNRWAFTHPAYRGRRLHAAVKRCALEAEVRQGRRGILSLVSAVNLESIHGGARAGCRRVGLVLTGCVAGRRFAWLSAGCRQHGVEVTVAPTGGGVGPPPVSTALVP